MLSMCFSIVSSRRMFKWKLVILLLLLIGFLFIFSLTSSPRVPPSNVHTTLVFIHIQKTAGSAFERSIVRRLHFGDQQSCICPNRSKKVKLRCNCTRFGQPWLISRFSVGWLCGVHADWTSYHRCLPTRINLEYGHQQRKFLYGTLIREPISRFISEYLHTLRGATWLSERLPCLRAQQLRNEYACWNRSNLTDFISCPFNSALNRQTRMLSSSSSVTNRCSNFIDLQRAKENLRSMEFFGLTEYLSLSQRLFERTSYCQQLPMCSFQSYLEQDWRNNQTIDYLHSHLTSNDVKHLKEMNSDDIELYQFARQLFFLRTCQILGVACQ